MSEIKELEELTGEYFKYEWFDDEDIYEDFRSRNTDGVFQFEKRAAKDILESIETDCFDDIIAANAMNRPGPLQLGQPAMYAENKQDISRVKDSIYYKQTKKTYGTVIYQEQIMAICREIGKLDWPDVDKVMKFMKGHGGSERYLAQRAVEEKELKDQIS